MTITDPAAARVAALEIEIRTLADLDTITPAQDSRLDAALSELTLARRAAVLERHAQAPADNDSTRGFSAPNVNFGRSPWENDLSVKPEARVAHAITAVERMDFGSDEQRSAIVQTLETATPEQGDLARWAVETSTPAYAGAFAKMFSDPMRGHLLWTDEERQAYQRVGTFTRAAMSNTDANGGFLSLPLALDPAVGLSNGSELNPLGRQLARQVTITGTDTWRKVKSAGVTAAFAAELAQVADGSPTFASDDIVARKWHAYVEASYEMAGDSMPADQVAAMFRDAADYLEAQKLMSGAGSGSNEPDGLITQLDANTNVEVLTTTAAEFGFVDVLKLDEALPVRFRANASFMAPRAVLNDIRQFGSGASPVASEFWANAAEGNPAKLLGQPIYESSEGLVAVTTTGNKPLVIGDFRAAYAVVRRAPTTIIPVPVVIGDAQRPIGAQGWYCYGRTGGGTLIEEAARLLVAG
jgi:HK97 family phage major capsid protein